MKRNLRCWSRSQSSRFQALLFSGLMTLFVLSGLNSQAQEQDYCDDPNVTEVCDLEAFAPGSHAVWLPSLAGNNTYVYGADGGKFVVYNDGTAHIFGTIERIDDNDKRWEVDIWLENARNWADWSALGRDYKDEQNFNTGEHVNWTYYEMNNSASALYGEGDFDGETLNLAHMPADYNFGFQCGLGANSKNLDWGISGWFTHTGSYDGHGDVNVNKDCDDCPPQVECQIFAECAGTDVTVHGGNDGSLSPVIYGSGNYDVQWSGPNGFSASTETISNLEAGCYMAVITDLDYDNCVYTLECAVAQPYPCEEDDLHRTQTPGGWGAPANGNNPGVYRDANFAGAFPAGLTVGCDSGFELNLTSASDVEDFLPSGGTPAVLTQNYTNPAGSLSNTFAGHLVALTLSVGFDDYDPNFSESDYDFEDLIIGSGDFAGMTVGDFVALANEIFGGCDNSYSPSDVTDGLAAINESYIDGQDSGSILDCFPPEEECLGELQVFCVAIDNVQLSCGESTHPDNTGYASFQDPYQGNPDCPEIVGLDWEDDETGTCPTTIVRTWTLSDTDGNTATCEQTIVINDDGAPTFDNDLQDLFLDCPDEVPAAGTVTASDGCDDDVSVICTENFQSQEGSGNCEVLNMSWDNEAGPRISWLPQMPGTVNPGKKLFSVESGTIERYDDGSAHLYGVMSHINNDQLAWEYDVWLTGGYDWAEWSGMGRSYKNTQGIAGDNYQDWTYYEVDGSNSTLTGIRDYDGSLLTLAHAPIDYHYGFQLGQNANIFTETFGMSGWFLMTGEIHYNNNVHNRNNVMGDFNMNLDCEEPNFEEECVYTIVRTCVATDDCGNSTSQTQVITVNDTTEPEFSETVQAEIWVDCADEVPAPGNITATDNCAGLVDVIFNEQVNGDEPCNYTITRNWIAEDDCGNNAGMVQVIHVLDDEDPTFDNVPGNISVECDEAIPSADNVTASDNCDDDVLVTVQTTGCAELVVEVCNVTAFNGNSSHIITLPDLEGNTPALRDYIAAPAGVFLEEYGNGTARLYGTVMNVTDNNKKFDVDVNMVNARDWADWSALGRSYKGGGGGDHTTWTYYEIDNSNSTLVGTSGGTWDGYTLNLTHAPANYNFGFQVGLGANDKTNTYGFSGWFDYTGTDASGAPIDGFGDINADGDCEPGGGQLNVCECVITRTFTATDDCGNVATATQTITVSDNTAPTIECPGPISVDCFEDVPAADISLVTANDACSNVTITWEGDDAQGEFCDGQVVRTYRATDECGNWTECTQIITHLDDEAPELIMPDEDSVTAYCGFFQADDAQAYLNGEMSPADSIAFVAYVQSLFANQGLIPQGVEDNCDPQAYWEETSIEILTDVQCPLVYQINCNFQAFDVCGNASDVETTYLYIIDDQPPVVEEVDDIVLQVCNADWPELSTTYSDECSGDGEVAGVPGDITTVGCVQSRVYTFTASDDCGNEASVTATVTRTFDETNPTIDAPGDYMLDTCNEAWPELSADWSDNCSDGGSIDGAAGDVSTDGCLQTRTYTFSVTDECGNSASATTTVTRMYDETNPTIDAPGDYMLDTCNEAWPELSADWSDNCSDGGSIDGAAGDVSTDGCIQTRTYTFSVTDECGNSASATTTVTRMYDETNPTIDAPGDYMLDTCNEAWPELSADWSDNCSDGGSIDGAAGDVSTDGCLQTRTYTFSVTDECGNSASATTTVTRMYDETNPTIDAPGDYMLDTCNEAWPELSADWSDNCSDGGSIDGVAGDVSTDGCLQTRTYTFSVTDECGNSASATTTVTRMYDETNPTIDAPGDYMLDTCNEAWPELSADWSDNCSDGGSIDGVAGDVSTDGCLQTRTYTFSVTDECGNSGSATTTVTRTSITVNPTITCPGPVSVQCYDEIPESDISTVTASAFCGDVTVTWVGDEEDGDDCSGTITRTYSATDICGNVAQCTQTLSYDDTIAPEFNEEIADLTVECVDDIPPFEECTATDNCDDDVAVSSFESSMEAGDTTCVITNAVGPGVDWGIVLFNFPGATDYYVFSEPGTMQIYNDGSAVLTGTVQAMDNANQQWEVFMRFENKRNWTEWSDLGRDYKDDLNLAGDNYLDWSYYELDNQNSFLIGAGDFDGSFLQLSHAPASYFFGFQCGLAANNKNANFGMSGWFFYEGIFNGEEVNGQGDVNVDKECEENNIETDCFYEVERYWIAVDDCGNTNIANQTITVEDTTAPEFTVTPGDLSVECYDEVPAPDVSQLEAEDNCGGVVTITFADDVLVGSECDGVISRSYDAEDECGNVKKYIQLITVLDEVAPVLSGVPANVTYSCEETLPEPANVTATDNCDDIVNVVFNESSVPGDCPQEEVITRTWTATDSCGNSVSDSQEITITDDIAPMITECPGEASYDCINDVPEADISLVSATDNCGIVTITHVGDTQNGDDCAGVIVRTYLATDECGNTSQCVQTITYNDNVAPVFDNAPENITVDCANVPDPMLVTASDNCSEVTIDFNEIEFSGGCPGVLQRTWIATDDCGNADTIEQYINLLDTVAPTLIGTPGDVTINCDDEVPAAADVTAIDNCDLAVDVDFLETTEDGDCPQEYSIIRTWSAMDTCENSVSHTQVITIVDDEAPVFNMGSSEITVACDDTPNIPQPTALDTCDPEVTITPDFSSTPGQCDNEWTEVYTWTATDDCGNSSAISYTINYIDEVAPVFTSVPGPIDVECDAEIPATMATATDNCGDANVTFADSDLIEDECQGYIIRTFTAEDACGLTSTATQTINIVDNTDPVITECAADASYDCITDVPAPDTSLITATDNCGDVTVMLHSEVSDGDDCEGTIVRTYRAYDDCGNYDECVQTINYNDNVAPVFDNAPENITVDCANVPDPMLVTASDNCSEVTIDFNEIEFSGGCPGVLQRTWIATDDCGNADTIEQYINLLDTVAPTLIGTPGDVTINCDDEVPAAADVTAIDNCDLAVDVDFLETTEDGDCPQEYSIIRTWSAMDTCENSVSHTQVITIVDDEAPVFNMGSSEITVACDDTPNIPQPTALDTCDPEVTITPDFSSTPGQCDNEWTEVYTWTATDDCGNSSAISYTINYIDEVAPVFTSVPGPIDVECDAEIPATMATATDNCGDANVTFADSDLIEDECQGYIIRTFTAEDACGLTSTATQTINIVDNTDPVITECAADASYDCITDVPAPDTSLITATDNCGDVTVMLHSEVSDGDDCEGTIVRTYRAYDDCGNYDECVQTINYNDNVAPVFDNAPENITVDCANVPDPMLVTASDNCSEVTIDFNEIEFSGGCPGVLQRTWIATDDCGNADTIEQYINLIDTIAPILNNVPEDETVLCSEADMFDMVANGASVQGSGSGNNLVFYPGDGTGTVENYPLGVSGDSAPGFPSGSFAANGEIYTVIAVTPMQLFGYDIKVGDIASMNYYTKREQDWTPQPSAYLNWYLSMLTEQDGINDDGTFFGNQLTFETFFSENVEAPANEWVQWSTDEGPNHLRVFDPFRGETQLIFGTYNDPHWSDVLAGPINWGPIDVNYSDEVRDYTDEDILLISFGTGSAWANGFEGQLDGFEIVLTNGDVATINFEPSPDGGDDEVTATDNCDESVDVIMSEVIIPGECPQEFTIERTWTATDTCENTASATQIITVEAVPPVISGENMMFTVDCDDEIELPEFSVTDECQPDIELIMSVDSIPGDCPNEWTEIYTWTATNACGLSDQRTVTYVYQDESAPEFTLVPDAIDVECDMDIPTTEASAIDNCGDVTITFADSDLIEDECQGYIIRTFTAEDACGNTNTATQTINIVDNTAPVITQCQDGGNYDCISDVPAADISLVSATDNCGTVTITHVGDAQDGDECAGVIVRTYLATDECGNSTECVTTFSYEDDVAPTFDVELEDIDANCDDLPDPAVVTATDNCSTATIDFSETVFSGGCPGVLERRWIAMDDCGNSDTLYRYITLIDTVAPELIGLPADASYECDEEIPAPAQVAAIDNCYSPIEVDYSESMEEGDCPQAYTILRTWTAEDNCENIVSYTQTISVSDNTDPVFDEIVGNITVSCDNVPAAGECTATDNCSDVEDIIISFEEVTSDGCPYTIMRTWTATDECGNSASQTQIITVVDEVAPILSLYPANMTVPCDDIPAAPQVTATDNCDIDLTVEFTESDFEGCAGSFTRTWSVTDWCNNNTTHVQTITVVDEVNPWFNQEVANVTVECDEVPGVPEITASDNCDQDVEVAFNESVVDEECEGTYTLIRTWTATDDCQNTNELVQVITVEDNTAPVFVDAPADENYTCSDSIPEMGDCVAVDNCSSNITYMSEEHIEGYTGEDGLAQCDLSTPLDVIGAEWALWLPNDIGEPQYYHLTENSGQFVELPNGRAHLTGTVYAPSNINKRWVIDVYFKNRKDWTEWSALGRSYKDDAGFAEAEMLYTEWDYYIMNADSAVLTGDGMYAGSSLDLAHAPASNYFGFQVGEAANNRNAADGMSGWFYYDGLWIGNDGVNGIGDFGFEKDCPECDYTITRIWTATDDCGNEEVAVQTITVQPGDEDNENLDESLPNKSPLIVMGAYPNPTSNRSFINFTVPFDSEVTLEVFNMDGKLIETLYRGEAAANHDYKFVFNAGDLANGIYLYKLTTNEASYLEKLMLAR